MGSPLGPVIAGIFMSHLEMNLITTMSDYMEPCTRYVDDTIKAIDPGEKSNSTSQHSPNSTTFLITPFDLCVNQS